MKIRIGNTRRAVWRELSEGFQSTSSTGDFLTLGGWHTRDYGAEQKVMLTLDRKEAEQLYERLKARFGKEGLNHD